MPILAGMKDQYLAYKIYIILVSANLFPVISIHSPTKIEPVRTEDYHDQN
jgi:hypothetical protein